VRYYAKKTPPLGWQKLLMYSKIVPPWKELPCLGRLWLKIYKPLNLNNHDTKRNKESIIVFRIYDVGAVSAIFFK